MSQFAFDLFLSYAREDHDLATRMVSWLRKCSFRVWIDEEQLVPGSRFRAGLQQGLRESCHLVALVTSAYTSRSWTQRELDLFDLTADHEERRLLAIQFDDINFGPLDQAFLVHQRIVWMSRSLDHEGFWKLYCGLKGRPPGPREQWRQNGQALLQLTPQNDSTRTRASDPTTERTIGRSRPISLSDPIQSDLSELARASLDKWNASWPATFLKLRDSIRQLETTYVLRNLLMESWALGNAQFAATISLALLPQMYAQYSVWPLLDLGCRDIVNWFLLASTLREFKPSEIWFSWAICEESWALLPVSAKFSPEKILSEHFQVIASWALDRNRPFKEVEESYDYGVMITPWNHFHLSWLAIRLGDPDAGLAHAKALCSTTTLGDVRTGRFLNRLTTWAVFDEIRSQQELSVLLAAARAKLGLVEADKIPDIKKRLSEIWQVAKSYIEGE
jgi:hypothetical protein